MAEIMEEVVVIVIEERGTCLVAASKVARDHLQGAKELLSGCMIW
jgi:hypothetical protein